MRSRRLRHHNRRRIPSLCSGILALLVDLVQQQLARTHSQRCLAREGWVDSADSADLELLRLGIHPLHPRQLTEHKHQDRRRINSRQQIPSLQWPKISCRTLR